MSRDLWREAEREIEREIGRAIPRNVDRERGRSVDPSPERAVDRERERTRLAREWSPSERLILPRTTERQLVQLDRKAYKLRASEVELLATVGAFRTVFRRDLEDAGRTTVPRGDKTRMHTDLRSVREQGLLQTRTLVIDRRPEQVAVLTRIGRELLVRSRQPREFNDSPAQWFYGGRITPPELAHDAGLYRMFETDRASLEAEGASITRVVLEHELQGDYYAQVYERTRKGVDADEARRAVAREHGLPFDRQITQFPDVRVEYETADGLHEWRDLELATEHYSRSVIGGKLSAGFRVYRTSGGRPSDADYLELIT